MPPTIARAPEAGLGLESPPLPALTQAPLVPPAESEREQMELKWNREAWEAKPALRAAYRQFYQAIAQRVDAAILGEVVEIGARFGRIKEVIPNCVTTDLVRHPWLDRRENAYALSFADDAVSHLLMIDVWHHLGYPGAALREFRRVLVAGGRLILLEPAISWFSRIVYGLLHYEPVALHRAVVWETPADFDPQRVSYYAAQGNATRLFWWGEDAGQLEGWRVREVTPLATFGYFATGGFSRPQFGGPRLQRWLSTLDRWAAVAPHLFAGRLLVVLEKA